MTALSTGAFHRGLELLTAHWVPFGSQKPSPAPQQNWFASHVSEDPVLLWSSSSWPCIEFLSPNSRILSSSCLSCLARTREAGRISCPSLWVWETGQRSHPEGPTRLGGGLRRSLQGPASPSAHLDSLLRSCSFVCWRGQKRASSGS